MTNKTIKNHPLEDLLEIESGSTPSNNRNPFMDDDFDEIDNLEIDEEEFYAKDTSLDNVMDNAPVEEFYDDIDKKNERKFQEVYNQAMEAFGAQVQEASLVEGRFRARNLEVAAQFLRLGLDSAKDAAHQKANKDKIKIAQNKTNGSNTQNNFFIGDRNELMKQLAEIENKQPKVINDQSDDK